MVRFRFYEIGKNEIRFASTLFLLCFSFFSSVEIYAQGAQMYQVKTFNQQLQPYGDLKLSINGKDYITIDSKGVAFINLNDSDHPIESVQVKDTQLEAASWNLSKGTLEIIIRKKSYHTEQVVFKGPDGKGISGLKITYHGKKPFKGTTNRAGVIEIPLPLDETISSASQFTIEDYDIGNLRIDNDQFIFSASPIVAPTLVDAVEIEVQDVQEPEPETEPQMTSTFFEDFDISKLDSIESLTVFYAIFKNYQIDDLEESVQKKVDAKFNQLVGELQDSLSTNSITYVKNINDSTYIEDDVKNLLAQARDESGLLVMQEQEFEEKIQLVKEKLEVGFENLSSEARVSLLADLNMLEQLLMENENKFYRNQSNFRQMILSLKDRFFDLEDLENKLTASELQRLAEQQEFRQRLIGISIIVGVFGVLILLLIYFSNKLKKQKVKLQIANNEVKRINENLENIVYERTKQLEETNKELDTVLYRASHDLRSPVCSIIGLCNIAATLSNGENTELFDKMVQTTKDMDKLLKKLSVISEINQPGDFEPIILSSVIANIRNNFRNVIDHNRINFVVECPEDLIVYSNPNLLEVILSNLIENALFYCIIKDTKEYKVVLSASVKDNNLELVMFDNGVGVERTMSDRLFDMFFRGNENSKGNGLGLYIVQKSVHALNGSVSVESEAGKFARFIVQLPLRSSNQQAIDIEEMLEEKTEKELASSDA